MAPPEISIPLVMMMKVCATARTPTMGALLRQVLQVVGAEEVLGQERGQQEQRDNDQADGELRVLGQPHKRIGLFIFGKRGHNYLSS